MTNYKTCKKTGVTWITRKPKTVADKDRLTALKLAVESYAKGYYSLLFANGKLMLNPIDKDIVIKELETVETDEYGRDGNGIDISGAIKLLKSV